MIVIPAIDLRGGRAVRLRRGDPSDETAYADRPVEVAERFQEEGARRLHVIDLDAALGEGDNREAIRDICRAVVVPVQVGGGIRSLEAGGRCSTTGPPGRSWGRRRPRTSRSWVGRSRSSPNAWWSRSTSARAT